MGIMSFPTESWINLLDLLKIPRINSIKKDYTHIFLFMFAKLDNLLSK